MNATPFTTGQWIWTPHPRANEYVLFAQTLQAEAGETMRVRITASTHYELWMNGTWISRGPVHGDPQWCQYDELSYEAAGPVQIAVLVHREEAYVHPVMPAPGGLIAEFSFGSQCVGTDEGWRVLDLEMWSQDVVKRCWALGVGEDYDATLEPAGWDGKLFDTTGPGWKNAVPVPDAASIWGNYQLRMTPYLERRQISAARYDAWQAPQDGAPALADVSRRSDEEELKSLRRDVPLSAPLHCAELGANAFTFDLGSEHVGFYYLDLEAPAGTIIEISGAELLRDGRPWIERKGVSYSVRYKARAGRQSFTPFGWSGFRYLHVVVRGEASGVTIHGAGCLERKAPLQRLPETEHFRATDEKLQQIFELCRNTLEVSVQEHLIDCPTREQAQYWGDAVYIAESLWKGWGEKRYLEWLLEGYLHAPLNPDGTMSSVYPGKHVVLLDYPLIPLLGQQFYRQETGSFYKLRETFEKAMQVKRWYDQHRNEAGLVDFDYEAFKDKGIINFIDHPGIGWHDFPHVGIDRDGTSSPLNLFFYGFLLAASEMAADLEDGTGAPGLQTRSLQSQAEALKVALLQAFYDGDVVHDAVKAGRRSDGTSWHANCLAVLFGVLEGEGATTAMREMLRRYDSVCRCSPYFHFFFLPAMRKAGLEEDALELIKREWQPMLDGGATTAWEGFLGDAKDTLCHPWSTPPFMFLLDSPLANPER